MRPTVFLDRDGTNIEHVHYLDGLIVSLIGPALSEASDAKESK